MALNRFDRPSRLAIQDTFVPQTVQLPFQEIAFGLKQRQTAFDNTEDQFESDIFSLDTKAREADRQFKNDNINIFTEEFEGITDQVSGDLSLAKRKARNFSKKVIKDKRQGKHFAVKARFEQEKIYFDTIDKMVEKGDLTSDKALLIKDRSKILTSQNKPIQDQDGNLNFDIITTPVNKEINVQEKMLELTKRLAKDGSGNFTFNEKKGLLITTNGKGISPQKAFKIAFQAGVGDRESLLSLNQDAELFLFATGNNVSEQDEKSLDKQIERLILLNNRDNKGQIIDLEIEQDIAKSFGRGTITDKLRVLGLLEAANKTANQLSGNISNLSVKGIPGFDRGSLEKKPNDLVMPLNIKIKPSNLDTIAKVDNMKDFHKSIIQSYETKLTDIKKDLIEKEPNVWITPDGIDKSADITNLEAAKEQAEADLVELLEGEKRVLKSVELSSEDINVPVNQAKIIAEKKRIDFEIEASNVGGPNGRGLQGEQREAFVNKKMNEEVQSLLKNNKNYQKYQKALKANAEAQTLTVGIRQLPDKAEKNTLQFIKSALGEGGAVNRIRRLGSDQDDEILTNDLLSQINTDNLHLDGFLFNPGEGGGILISFQAKTKDGTNIGRFSIDPPIQLLEFLTEEGSLKARNQFLNEIATKAEQSFNRSFSFGGIEFEVNSQTELTNQTNVLGSNALSNSGETIKDREGNEIRRPLQSVDQDVKSYTVIYTKKLTDGTQVRVPANFSSRGEATNFFGELLSSALIKNK